MSPLPKNAAENAKKKWQTPSTTNDPEKLRNDLLFDPILAPYLKLPQKYAYDIYFRLLKKHTTIKNVDFYQKYLLDNSEQGFLRLPTQLHLLSRLKLTSPHNNSFNCKNEAPEEDKEVSLLSSSAIRQHTTQALFENRACSADVQYAGRRRPRTVTESTEELDSGVKRKHPQVAEQTLLREFKECPVPTLVNLITRMLQLLVNLNDRNAPLAFLQPMVDQLGETCLDREDKLLTRYHLRTPPAISIDTYISRLVKFNNFTQANLLCTIFYIDLLSHNYQPHFTLNLHTVHRFLLVATMLAQKALEDFFYTNDHYAKVGGVALTELNCLELDFLNRVDWKVVPAKQSVNGRTSIRHQKEVLDMYYWQLVTLMGIKVTETNNIVYTFEERDSRL